jgi:hypothetical protein
MVARPLTSGRASHTFIKEERMLLAVILLILKKALRGGREEKVRNSITRAKSQKRRHEHNERSIKTAFEELCQTSTGRSASKMRDIF